MSIVVTGQPLTLAVRAVAMTAAAIVMVRSMLDIIDALV
jgi:hypothetical protein